MAALVDQRPPRKPLTTPSGVPIVSLVPYLPTLVAVTVAVIPQLSGRALPPHELLMASALVMVAGAMNLFGLEGAAQAAAAALVH